MIAVGMIMLLWAYAIIYWSLKSMNNKTQPSFMSYVLPFGK
jgi:hypothetical protein